MEMAGRDRNGFRRGADADEADRAVDRHPGTPATDRADSDPPELEAREGPGDWIHLADQRNRPRSLLRYGIAATAVGLTYSLKPLIESWVGPGPPLLLFVPAVTVGAWVGGLGPGLLATTVSALVCTYFYLPPLGSLAIHVPNDLFRLVVFMAEGILISTLMETLHGARRKSEASTRAAERYQEVSRRGEETLRAILDNSLAVVFLKDTAGRYILLNRRFEERFHRAAGYPWQDRSRPFSPADCRRARGERPGGPRTREGGGDGRGDSPRGPVTHLSLDQVPPGRCGRGGLRGRRHCDRHYRAQAGRTGAARERAVVPVVEQLLAGGRLPDGHRRSLYLHQPPLPGDLRLHGGGGPGRGLVPVHPPGGPARRDGKMVATRTPRGRVLTRVSLARRAGDDSLGP